MARSPWSLSRVAIGMTILYASYELMNRHGGPPVALTQELMKDSSLAPPAALIQLVSATEHRDPSGGAAAVQAHESPHANHSSTAREGPEPHVAEAFDKPAMPRTGEMVPEVASDALEEASDSGSQNGATTNSRPAPPAAASAPPAAAAAASAPQQPASSPLATTTPSFGPSYARDEWPRPPGTVELYPGELAAPVPCTPPYCHFRCQARPANVSCEPPPREAARPRVCFNADNVSQVFLPIGFSIPDEEVVACLPRKARDFATIVPGDKSTYIFNDTDKLEYKRDYRRSFYGLTWKKHGWDCMRHYEVLASGSVPWFKNLERSPSGAVSFLPKQLLLSARDLRGVRQGHINHQVFDPDAYYEKACQLLEYTRRHLTSSAMARYLLEAMGMPEARSVLLINDHLDFPDYQADLLLIGMRKLLGRKAVDYPPRAFLYEYPEDTPPHQLGKGGLYGKGFSYSHRLADDPGIDRSDIEQRIRVREFDLVVFAVTRQPDLPYHDLVMRHYDPSRVAFIDGADWVGWSGAVAKREQYWGRAAYFMRELPDGCPPLHKPVDYPLIKLLRERKEQNKQ